MMYNLPVLYIMAPLDLLLFLGDDHLINNAKMYTVSCILAQFVNRMDNLLYFKLQVCHCTRLKVVVPDDDHILRLTI